MKSKEVKTETKQIKAIWTQEMADDLVSFDGIGIDAEKTLHDILSGELEQAIIKERIENREKKIDELLNEEDKQD